MHGLGHGEDLRADSAERVVREEALQQVLLPLLSVCLMPTRRQFSLARLAVGMCLFL